MDPCSQALLGASLSCSFSKKKDLSKASICGLAGGFFPDLDIIIKSENDPLLFLEYHRHFTHSLFFVPIGGLIVSGILYITFFRKKISFSKIYLFSSLGIFTHGLLDACTSYGTSLYWPFSNERVSWSIISIIDPIFTLILILGFIFCIKLKSKIYSQIGFLFSIVYLMLGLFKHNLTFEFVKNLSNERGHEVERFFLNPTIGNNILWRSIYQFEGNYYVDAIYIPLISPPKFKKGSSVNKIDKENHFQHIKSNSQLMVDIDRFSFFSQGYIYFHPDFRNVIADLRYGTLPFDLNSLWGIEINEEKQDSHVEFKNLRNFKSFHYKEFWEMLKGNLN